MPASIAMLAGHAGAAPATLETGHAIRQLAGYRHGGRTAPTRICAAAESLGLEIERAAGAELTARLADGYAFMLPVHLERLPARLHLERGAAGGHCGAIAGLEGELVGWYDPWRPRGSRPTLEPLAELLAAAWARPLPGVAPASASAWRFGTLASKGVIS